MQIQETLSELRESFPDEAPKLCVAENFKVVKLPLSFFFAVEIFAFDLSICRLGKIIANAKSSGLRIHPDFPYDNGDTVKISGIL